MAEVVKKAMSRANDSIAAVYVDFEDDGRTFLLRLRALGINPEDAAKHCRYYSGSSSLRSAAESGLEGIESADLVVIDTTNSAMAHSTLDPVQNADALEFVHQVRQLQSTAAEDAAFLLLDHEPISTGKERRQAIGAQAKLASVDGAQYRVVALEQPRPGAKGVLALYVTKDRIGQVRAHAATPDDGIQHAATIILSPRLVGNRLDFEIVEPTMSLDGSLVEAIEKVAAEKGLFKNQIETLVRGEGVKVSTSKLGKTVDQMVSAGLLKPEKQGNSIVFRTSHASSESTEEHRGEPSSHLAEDHLASEDAALGAQGEELF